MAAFTHVSDSSAQLSNPCALEGTISLFGDDVRVAVAFENRTILSNPEQREVTSSTSAKFALGILSR